MPTREKTFEEHAADIGISVNAFTARVAQYGLDDARCFAKKTSCNMVLYKGHPLTRREAAKQAGINPHTLQTRVSTLGQDSPDLFVKGRLNPWRHKK